MFAWIIHRSRVFMIDAGAGMGGRRDGGRCTDMMKGVKI